MRQKKRADRGQDRKCNNVAVASVIMRREPAKVLFTRFISEHRTGRKPGVTCLPCRRVSGRAGGAGGGGSMRPTVALSTGLESRPFSWVRSPKSRDADFLDATVVSITFSQITVQLSTMFP